MAINTRHIFVPLLFPSSKCLSLSSLFLVLFYRPWYSLQIHVRMCSHIPQTCIIHVMWIICKIRKTAVDRKTSKRYREISFHVVDDGDNVCRLNVIELENCVCLVLYFLFFFLYLLRSLLFYLRAYTAVCTTLLIFHTTHFNIEMANAQYVFRVLFAFSLASLSDSISVSSSFAYNFFFPFFVCLFDLWHHRANLITHIVFDKYLFLPLWRFGTYWLLFLFFLSLCFLKKKKQKVETITDGSNIKNS